MMRSLWTAASGMIAQQTNVDNIANNLANVNTTAYKTSTTEFKTLLYQNIQAKTTSANGENKPTGAQVGLGVRNSSITTQFTQGALLESNNTYAMAIEGKGFFAVQGEDGNTYYTRNGNFQISLNADGSGMLATTDGLPVLSSEGEPIVFDASILPEDFYEQSMQQILETSGPEKLAEVLGVPKILEDIAEEMVANGQEVTEETLLAEYLNRIDEVVEEILSQFDLSKVTIDSNGEICYKDFLNNPKSIGVKLGLYQVANPAGMNKTFDTLYSVTEASGEAVEEGDSISLTKSKVHQGYLEGSNVQVVDEMVNLISAQRAYEMNSKAITTADEMLGQANQLKR